MLLYCYFFYVLCHAQQQAGTEGSDHAYTAVYSILCIYCIVLCTAVACVQNPYTVGCDWYSISYYSTAVYHTVQYMIS